MRATQVVLKLVLHAGGCVLLALLLMLLGLADRGHVERSQVDPEFPGYLTYLIEARGFPFPWLVTDRSEAVAELSLRDRFLAPTFREDWFLLLVPASLLWSGGMGVRALRRRRRGSSGMRGPELRGRT